MTKLDIRAELHSVIGHLRRNEVIAAYELILRMSRQMDEEFYSERQETGGDIC